MSKSFKSKNGKTTDILHSHAYYKAPFRMRQEMAFNKEFRETLTERDKYLMMGYAQAKVEESRAYRYNHKKYVRKNSSPKYTANDLKKHFYN